MKPRIPVELLTEADVVSWYLCSIRFPLGIEGLKGSTVLYRMAAEVDRRDADLMLEIMWNRWLGTDMEIGDHQWSLIAWVLDEARK